MKEKRKITIIDKKQIPSEEPARQYYLSHITIFDDTLCCPHINKSSCYID